jgi:phosphoribosylformylglycinamidine synthase
MLGVEVTLPIKSRKDFSYFSETQSRIIVSVPDNKKNEFEKLLHSSSQTFTLLGKVSGQSLKINDNINVKVDDLADIYFNTIPRIMSGEK